MVAVVFCDLVDSTALSVRLGPDAADRLRHAYFGALRQTATEHGGAVVKNLGDGLMISFSSVVDASGCARALPAVVAAVGDELDLSLQLRVGLSAGEAREEDGDWFGMPVVEASRLCAVARPGQIVVADRVVELLDGRGEHRFTSLGDIPVKGVVEPLRASELVWGAASAPRIQVAGSVALEGPRGCADDRALGGRQGRLAFVRLVTDRDQPVAKENLADTLWPDRLPATWEPALRGIVSKVRAFLASAGLDPESVSAVFGCYQLQLPPGTSVDVAQAIRAVSDAERAMAGGDVREAAALAAQAQDVLARPVLPAESGEWLERLRAELGAARLRALDVLAGAELALGRAADALRTAETAVALEPFRESAHRLVMAAHEAAGSRGEALRAYERCRRLLAEELGVRPAPETDAAYLALLGEEPEPSSALPDPAVVASTTPTSLGVAATPLVGRIRELAALADAVAAVSRGAAPPLVLVSGEAGAGKTRLLTEAARMAAQHGMRTVYGRCDEDLTIAYQPIIEVLTALVAATPIDELAERLGPNGGELVRLVPDIARLVPNLAPPLESDPETERYRLHQAVIDWLATDSEPDGLMLVLDDLHWTEAASVQLLRAALVSGRWDRLVVVAAYRPGELDDDHPLVDLLGDVPRVGALRLELAGLDLQNVTKLVSEIAASVDVDQAAAAIHAGTNGNPLFVVELARHLTTEGAHDPSRLPTTISDVIAHRLRRRPESTVQTLHLASVIGTEFGLDLLAGVSALDDDALIAALEDAVRARLVEETAVNRFHFSHAVVRDAIYQQLSASRRARIHASVATLLEVQRSDDVAALAHHFGTAGAAGPAGKALAYMTAAGDLATARLAWDQAASVYREAVRLAEHDPGVSPRALNDLRVRLGEAMRDAGHEGWRETLLDAAQSARDLGDDDTLVRAALANTRGFWSAVGGVDEERLDILESAVAVAPSGTAAQARLQMLLANERIYSSRRDERFALADAALATARALDDPELLVDVLTRHIPVLTTAPMLDTRLTELAELTSLADTLGDPRRQALAALWGWSANLDAGDLDHARWHLDRAVRLSRELEHPTLQWLAANFQAIEAGIRGELDVAEQRFIDAFALGQTAAEPDAAAWFGAGLGFVRIAQGRLGELIGALVTYAEEEPAVVAWRAAAALAHLQLGDADGAAGQLALIDVAELATRQHDVFWLISAGITAEVAAAIPRADQGSLRTLYDALAPFAGQIAAANVSAVGSVERYLGLLAGAIDDERTALTHLEAAVSVHDRLGAAFWLAQSQLDLADILRGTGERHATAEAERLTASALAAATTRGFDGLVRRIEGATA